MKAQWRGDEKCRRLDDVRRNIAGLRPDDAEALAAARAHRAESDLARAVDCLRRAVTALSDAMRESTWCGAEGCVDDASAFLSSLEEGHQTTAQPSLAPGAGVSGMWNTFDVEPEVGRKFIALYDDGSGAVMLWRYDGGFIDQDGDDFTRLSVAWDHWAYLPDDLEFWCETLAEDPVILRLPDPQRLGGDH